MKQSGVYCITNTVNGKQYVGSAVNLAVRWVSHRSRLRTGNHHNPHMQAAWNKYGPDVFTFTVLEECPPARLVEREQWWIDTLDCVRHGYNIRLKANSNQGIVQSVATRALRGARIREAYATNPAKRVAAAQRMRAVYADPIQRAFMERRTRAGITPDVVVRRSQSIQERYKNDPALHERLTEGLHQRYADPAYRAAHRQGVKAAWRAGVGSEAQQRFIEASKDPIMHARRAHTLRATASTPEYRARMALIQQARMADPELRARTAQQGRERWADPAYREMMLAARRKAPQEG